MPSSVQVKEWSKPSSLQLPMDQRCVSPAKSFVKAYALRQDLATDQAEQISVSIERVLHLVIRTNENQWEMDTLTLEMSVLQESLVIRILNRGYPFFFGESWKHSAIDRETQAGLEQIAQRFDSVKFENLGRNGQSLTLKTQLSRAPITQPIEPKSLVFEEELEYRLMRPEEATELSRLFCGVYGYDYIHDYVYFPEKIKSMIESGDLVSRIAVRPNGHFAAHVGMVRLNQGPDVYEIALGLTDPRVKSKGSFSQLFDQVMQLTERTEMSYCIFDFVTNHDYSQKLVSRYGSCDLALNVGCQISETQASLEKLGIGKDPQHSDRYSLLLGVKPKSQAPFSGPVTLPVHLGEMLEFLLEPIGTHWLPAPRFYPLAQNGDYVINLQASQKAIYFDFHQPGFSALKKIRDDWRHYLRNGYLYAAVDIPLGKSGIGQIYDYLANQGFFIAGLVPYHNGNTLALRLQSIGPMRLDFDEIKLATPTSIKLLDVVRQTYERNVIL